MYEVTYLLHHFLTDAEQTTETMTQPQLAALLRRGDISLISVKVVK